MKIYTIIVGLIFLLPSCVKQNNDISHILDHAEKIIGQYPDSSLRILNSILLDKISNSEDKARYALLKSISLDKCYIDVKSDSLTSIALAYYDKNGSPDEKLKAYYYNGKINSYAGNYERALDNYINAEKYVENSSDYTAIGMLYNAKMIVYKSIYDMKQAIKPAELSVYYFLQAKDTIRYIRSLNTLSSILLSADEFNYLEDTFRKIEKLESKMSPSHKNDYYVNLINYKLATKDSSLGIYVKEYMKFSSDNENLINWTVLVRAYNHMKDYASAIHILEKCESSNLKLQSPYFYFASDTYSSVGDYEKAYKYLLMHHNDSSKEDLKIFQSDAKFLEERYSFEENKMKQKYLILVLILSIILIVIVVLLVSVFVRNLLINRNQKLKEGEEQRIILTNEYEKAIIEQNKLRSLVASNKLQRDTIKVLEERMIILNSFIVSNISGTNMERSLKELNNYLSDNDKFFRSTRMSFELTHPRFISYLTKRGLSGWEIGCCCLYCIGLNGSEISNFLNIKYFYKQSSAIRKKLDIQSINIDKFLVEKLKELG